MVSIKISFSKIWFIIKISSYWVLIGEY
jgi:hypothetical protein